MTNIEKNVMRRVHTIHLLRPVTSMSAASFVVAVFSLYLIGREVWVARVFENAPAELAALPQFYLSAFTNTDLVVQMLTVLVAASLIYLARATAKLVTHSLVPVHA